MSVELSVGLLLAIVITAALISASLLGVAQATAAEASAQLARQAARGDDASLRAARDRVPADARIRLERQPEGVWAEVTMPVSVLKVGVVEVKAEAWAAYEPGEGP